VLSLVLLAFAYAAGRQLAGHRAGLGAAALCAVYPQLALLPSLGSAANFYLPAMLLVAMGAVALRRGRVAPGVVILLAGTLWLWTARSEAPVFAAVAMLAASIKAPRAKQVLATSAAVLVFSTAVIAAGWIVPRSDALGGRLTSVTSTGGFNFWLGNADGASGSQKHPPTESAALKRKLKAIPATKDYERERDRLLLDDAVDNIRSNPAHWGITEIKKLAMALTFDPYDGRIQVVLVAFSTLALSAIAFVVLVSWGAFRRIRSGRWIYLGLALAQVVLSTVFFALNRYKLGIDLPLLILLAVGLMHIDRAEVSEPPVYQLREIAGPKPIVWKA
jgi:hypothetical protein